MIPGGVHYACEIGADQIRINFQNNAGNNLTVGGGQSADRWLLNLGFESGDGGNVGYSAILPQSGSLGIDDNGLSYEGPLERVEDFDLANATVVDAKVAVNCSSPGGEPTAIVGGTEYVIPFSEAQSITCDVTDEAINVKINRLGLDGTQLMISAQYDGTNWNGSAAVQTPDGNFSAPFTSDVEGPVADGSAVSFEGTFGSDGGDVEGAITVTCP